MADGTLLCDATTPRTVWQRSSIGFVRFSCPITGSDDDSICSSTFGFRGASSTDPDNDIVSWSIDFGDGTSASREWPTDPPTEVAHAYPRWLVSAILPAPTMTLTVTDSAGQSAVDSMTVTFDTPD